MRQNNERISVVKEIQKSEFWVRLALFAFILFVCSLVLGFNKSIVEYLLGKNETIFNFWIQVSLPFLAVVAFSVGFSLTIRRTKAIEAQAEATAESTAQMKESQKNQMEQFSREMKFRYEELKLKSMTDKNNNFNVYVNALDNKNVAVRLSGINGLYRIAQNASESGKSSQNIKYIFTLLCSFIRNFSNDERVDCVKLDDEWKNKKRSKVDESVQEAIKLLFSRDINNPFRNRGYQANLTSCNLQCIDFTGLYFENVNFGNSAMHGAKMYSELKGVKTSFCGCEFHDTYLNAANLSNSEFKNCDFSNAKMIYVNMWGSCVEKSNFYGADMTCSQLGEAKFRDSNFEYAVLDGAYILGILTPGSLRSIMRSYYDEKGNLNEYKKNVLVHTSLRFAFIYPHNEFFYNGFQYDCAIFINYINIQGWSNDASIIENSIDRVTRILNALKLEEVVETISVSEIDHITLNINDLVEQKKILKVIAKKIIDYAIPYSIEGLDSNKLYRIKREMKSLIECLPDNDD